MIELMSAFDPLRTSGNPAILRDMNAPDTLSPEAHDPFYVPDRTSEAVSFASAGLSGILAPITLFEVPLRPAVLGIVLAMSLFAILSVIQGVAARRRRLSRAQQVDELRASVLRSDDGPAKA